MVNMLNLSSGVFLLSVFLLNTATALMYEYEFLEAFANSSDTDIIDVEVDVERISRGEYGMIGFIEFKKPITDEFSIQIDVFRSSTGTGDWRKMPYSYAKSGSVKCFDTIYRKILMDTFKTCSNAPQLEVGWKGPFPAGRYNINKCQMSKDQLPSYLPDGYYKIHTLMEGPAILHIQLLMKLENKF